MAATYDPETRSGTGSQAKRKVKGTVHWVSAQHAVRAEVRVYDNLFCQPDPDDVEDGQDWRSNLNPDSLEVIESAVLEPSLAGAQPDTKYQFERTGYFCVDQDSTPEHLVFNRTVSLRDTWAKIQKKG